MFKLKLRLQDQFRHLLNRKIKLPSCNPLENIMTEDVTVTYVTAPNEEVARDLAKQLIGSRLAACVNMVKTVESIYEWEDEICHDNETLMMIKSNSKKAKELTTFIESHHPYKCPEVLTVKVDSGSQRYIDWVNETVNKPPIKEEKE